MKALIRTAAVTLCLLPAVLFGQAGVIGNWGGAMPADTGEVSLQIEFRQDGEAVAGIVFIDGTEQYFKEGAITGDGLQFTTGRLREGDRDVPYNWRGVLVENSLTFTVTAADNDGPAREFTLTRQAR